MENSGKYIFEKLTPANNTDIKVYEDALEFVFKENKVFLCDIKAELCKNKDVQNHSLCY